MCFAVRSRKYDIGASTPFKEITVKAHVNRKGERSVNVEDESILVTVSSSLKCIEAMFLYGGEFFFFFAIYEIYDLRSAET